MRRRLQALQALQLRHRPQEPMPPAAGVPARKRPVRLSLSSGVETPEPTTAQDVLDSHSLPSPPSVSAPSQVRQSPLQAPANRDEAHGQVQVLQARVERLETLLAEALARIDSS